MADATWGPPSTTDSASFDDWLASEEKRVLAMMNEDSSNNIDIDTKCANMDCRKEGAQFTCSKCHIAKYCGRDCQTTHWGNHKSFCKKHREKNHIPTNTTGQK